MNTVSGTITSRTRRHALAALLASGAMASALPSEARPAAKTKKATFVLVHGSWHGAWCFEKLVPRLQTAGHAVITMDLPGHGLNARFPKSYFRRPLDAAQFAAEESLIAGSTLKDYAAVVSAAVDRAHATSEAPVVLLGHSMGGLPITLAAEAAPQKIQTIVYLTAFMVPDGMSVGSFGSDPAGEGAKTGVAMKSDPAVTGALRIDPNSDDAAYLADLKAALAGDVGDDDWAAMRHLLTPDVPVGLFATAVRMSRERWGRVPRAYIKCTDDFAIRPKLQDKFIALADQATPGNPTQVHSLASSHSAFMSMPDDLARILLKIARSN